MKIASVIKRRQDSRLAGSPNIDTVVDLDKASTSAKYVL